MLYLELFCKYNTLIRILDYSAMKKIFVDCQALREAWRLTGLSSAMPSECVGEAGFTDTLRPHADYGNRLNTGCSLIKNLSRRVTLRLLRPTAAKNISVPIPP